jgi:hypothetical protein
MVSHGRHYACREVFPATGRARVGLKPYPTPGGLPSRPDAKDVQHQREIVGQHMQGLSTVRAETKPAVGWPMGLRTVPLPTGQPSTIST